MNRPVRPAPIQHHINNLPSHLNEQNRRLLKIDYKAASGGDVASGVGAYNFMRMQPVPVRTYAVGVCSSVAATMFMAGIDRISAAVNSFSLHAASYSDGPKSGQITDSTSLICAPFRTVSEWDEALIIRHFGSTASTYLTADDALRLRIATHVKDLIFDRSEPVTHVAIPDQKSS